MISDFLRHTSACLHVQTKFLAYMLNLEAFNCTCRSRSWSARLSRSSSSVCRCPLFFVYRSYLRTCSSSSSSGRVAAATELMIGFIQDQLRGSLEKNWVSRMWISLVSGKLRTWSSPAPNAISLFSLLSQRVCVGVHASDEVPEGGLMMVRSVALSVCDGDRLQ